MPKYYINPYKIDVCVGKKWLHIGNFIIQPNGKRRMLQAGSMAKSAEGVLDSSTHDPLWPAGPYFAFTDLELSSEKGHQIGGKAVEAGGRADYCRNWIGRVGSGSLLAPMPSATPDP